ncbi:MAG: hypothetical protein ACWGON_11510 [Gemmatimonadota bacterium]
MKPTDRPYQERLQMALEAARDRSAPERDVFLTWLKAADPQMAADVLLRLSAPEDPGASNDE